jgi:hypothetical protein
LALIEIVVAVSVKSEVFSFAVPLASAAYTVSVPENRPAGALVTVRLAAITKASKRKTFFFFIIILLILLLLASCRKTAFHATARSRVRLPSRSLLAFLLIFRLWAV